jgi:antitoxin FitA
MASITIRRLDDAVKAKLRVRAATHGRSMEEEAREILKASLGASPAPQANLVDAMRSYFEPFGGITLKLPKRRISRRPLNFE